MQDDLRPAARAAHAALAFGVYFCSALLATWPMARVGADHLVSHFGPEDILLHTWNLAWDVHALSTHPTALFQANILHPAPSTLALSEHLLGQLPIFAPVWALGGNPVLAFNVNVLFSFVLSGWFTHWLVLRWTSSAGAAYTAGLAFALAPWRLEAFHWSQVLSVQYFPLVLYALDRAAVSQRLSRGVLAGLALMLQMLCSYYLAYMALVLAGCYAIADVVVRGVRGRAKALAALGLALLIPAAVMLPLSLPYLELRRAGVLALPDAVPQEAFEYVVAAFGSPGRLLATQVGWGAAGLSALAILSLARARGDRDVVARIAALAATVVAALGCAVGPAGLLGGWFAPYAWLAAVVPGFSAVRLPARFAFLCSFAMAVLAGLGVASLLALVRERLGPAATWIASLATAAIALLPLAARPAPRVIAIPVGEDVPAVYRWLAEHGDGGALLELPVGNGLPAPGTKHGRAAAMAMYFSTYHWLPILNGYSGYFPDSYLPLMQQAARLPDAGALRVLVDCTGLRWILIREAGPRVRATWDGLPDIRFRGAFRRSDLAEDALYEIERVPGAPCPLDFSAAPRRPVMQDAP